jgi:protein TonB
VALSHLVLLLALIAGDKIVHPKPAVAVMLMAAVRAQSPKPPPPPERQPPAPKNIPKDAPGSAAKSLAKAAPARLPSELPPLRDIEVTPKTDVLPTLLENSLPVLAAGGAGEAGGKGSGGANGAIGGSGGNGSGGGNGGSGHVRVAAIIDPSTCQRPSLPPDSLRGNDARVAVLRILVDVDGKVIKTALLRSSGWSKLDEKALAVPYSCQFVAGTLDGAPVPSWEYFKVTWDGK